MEPRSSRYLNTSMGTGFEHMMGVSVLVLTDVVEVHFSLRRATSVTTKILDGRTEDETPFLPSTLCSIFTSSPQDESVA